MWVYDNEIDTFSETVEDGGLIELHDFDDYFMGIGFVNRRSKITVRMLSRHEGEINEEFIKQRVKDAVSYRMDTVDTSSCRLIFGDNIEARYPSYKERLMKSLNTVLNF